MGAGLLAKASCQAIQISTDPPLSRASPLPQGSPVFNELLTCLSPTPDESASRLSLSAENRRGRVRCGGVRDCWVFCCCSGVARPPTKT
ncbi:hypothetical protein C1894_07195 [Pseudomonas sp. FW305-3-2-15-E-TSA2]|nr:hypothetical protein C1895_03385 [Pseudomonas sp. FW305-3-2-15-E-TSA4]POA43576.1 hypothetical protein C1894_07195 [Pseudomonas sp. FW305-3-2-15-E-TSA2]